MFFLRLFFINVWRKKNYKHGPQYCRVLNAERIKTSYMSLGPKLKEELGTEKNPIFFLGGGRGK